MTYMTNEERNTLMCAANLSTQLSALCYALKNSVIDRYFEDEYIESISNIEVRYCRVRNGYLMDLDDCNKASYVLAREEERVGTDAFINYENNGRYRAYFHITGDAWVGLDVRTAKD